MNRYPLRIGLLVVALAAGGATAGVASSGQPESRVTGAGTEQTDAEAARLFREVMSPFCPGLTLADCPSPNAFELRGEIQRRLDRGESRQAILDELVATYGTQILSDPSDTPIGAIVWGVPFALAALAALGLALVVRRATHAHTPEPAVAAAGAPGLSDRLDDELSQLD